MYRVPFFRLTAVLGLVTAASCADRITTISPGASADARVGDVVRVQMRLIGFSVDSVPTISSRALALLGQGEVREDVITPAGPLWEFRFAAVAPGQAIVTIQRHGPGDLTAPIYDTVNVR